VCFDFIGNKQDLIEDFSHTLVRKLVSDGNVKVSYALQI